MKRHSTGIAACPVRASSLMHFTPWPRSTKQVGAYAFRPVVKKHDFAALFHQMGKAVVKRIDFAAFSHGDFGMLEESSHKTAYSSAFPQLNIIEYAYA